MVIDCLKFLLLFVEGVSAEKLKAICHFHVRERALVLDQDRLVFLLYQLRGLVLCWNFFDGLFAYGLEVLGYLLSREFDV
jgi:hypothetical protein